MDIRNHVKKFEGFHVNESHSANVIREENELVVDGENYDVSIVCFRCGIVMTALVNGYLYTKIYGEYKEEEFESLKRDFASDVSRENKLWND